MLSVKVEYKLYILNLYKGFAKPNTLLKGATAQQPIKIGHNKINSNDNIIKVLENDEKIKKIEFKIKSKR